MQLHLLAVFHYTQPAAWEHAEGPPAIEFAQKISTPGKELVFHQFLMTSSAPKIELAYDIELSRNFRRATHWSAASRAANVEAVTRPG